MATMKQLWWLDKDKIDLIDVEIPEVKPNEVKVKIRWVDSEQVTDENAAQLLAGADGKSILALLLLGIPAACAAGCLCMFGAAALQVSGRIRAYSFRKTAGQACSGARELMGQYLLVIVVFLPLCGAATGLAYLGGKIL